MKIRFVFLLSWILISNQRCINKFNNPVDWFFSILYPSNKNEDKELTYVYFDNESDHLERYEYNQKSFPPERMSQDPQRLIEWNTYLTKGFIQNTKQNSNAFVLHTLDDINNFNVNKPHSFFCISVDDKNVKKLISSFILMKIQLNSNTKNALMSTLSFDDVNNSFTTDEITRIKTLNDQIMILFTKTALGKLLPYEYTIRNYYNESFYVKSNTKYLLNKICEDNRLVLNILSVEYGNKINLSERDNCKWAVSISDNTCCFGDFNFDNESKAIGGNTICFKNDLLSTILKSLIETKEDCQEKVKQDEKDAYNTMD